MIYTSHYRKKDGAWQLIVSYKDSDGRWKQKSKQGFETRSAAKQYEAELRKSHGGYYAAGILY